VSAQPICCFFCCTNTGFYVLLFLFLSFLGWPSHTASAPWLWRPGADLQKKTKTNKKQHKHLCFYIKNDNTFAGPRRKKTTTRSTSSICRERQCQIRSRAKKLDQILKLLYCYHLFSRPNQCVVLFNAKTQFFVSLIFCFFVVFFKVAEPHSQCPMAVETWGGPPTKYEQHTNTHKHVCFYSKKYNKLVGPRRKKTNKQSTSIICRERQCQIRCRAKKLDHILKLCFFCVFFVSVQPIGCVF
jgi:hypothetical protein